MKRAALYGCIGTGAAFTAAACSSRAVGNVVAAAGAIGAAIAVSAEDRREALVGGASAWYAAAVGLCSGTGLTRAGATAAAIGFCLLIITIPDTRRSDR